MSNFKPKFPLQLIITIILTLGLSISFQSLLAAWTAPTVAPPGGSILPPIYNSGTNVIPVVNSDLTVNGNFYVSSKFIMKNNGTSGALGIGTTNPISSLHIYGNDPSTNGVSMTIENGDIGGGKWNIGVADERPGSGIGGSLYIADLNAPGDHRFIIDKFGKIGVGTVLPEAGLHIKNIPGSGNSNIIIEEGTGKWLLGIDNSPMSLNIVDKANGDARRLTVLANGNVGIGTMNPSQKLDVNGKIIMRTQTTAGDSNDTVATKKYVDDKIGISCTWNGWQTASPGVSGNCGCSTWGTGLELNCVSNVVVGVRTVNVCMFALNGCGCSCFRKGTKVSMMDGKKKNIEEVKVGDKVMGSDGKNNTVVKLDRPVIGGRNIFVINEKVRVTGEHPFMSDSGWVVPDLYLFIQQKKAHKRYDGIEPRELKIGDKLKTREGIEIVKSIKVIDNAPDDEVVYDFEVTGDHTYIADGYVVWDSK